MKVAIVTGHTRGLGAAIAERLLEEGVNVVGVARGSNAALEERFGQRLRQTRMDLSDLSGVQRWVDGGHLARCLDGAAVAYLVNNAGLLEPVGPLEVQGQEAIANAVAVNVAAALMLAAGFARATSQLADRRILHVSSGAGSDPYAGWSVYCATKAALDHHARAVALDRSPGLRIAAVAPGVVDTDMQAIIRDTDADRFPTRERFVRLHEEGRLRTPADAARSIVDRLLSADFGEEPVTDARG